MKKQTNATYLVAKYLQAKKKGQICDMKKSCKCNNVAERIRSLRVNFGWEINTILLGYNGRIAIWEYQLKKVSVMPKEWL